MKNIPPGRVAIVTGASRGLGREIALTLGKAGHRVLAGYRQQEQQAADVVREIVLSGAEAASFKADVGNADQVDALFRTAVERWGRVDLVVNNAGMTRDGLMLKMREDDWDTVLETNLKGPFHAIRAASRIMREQHSGHIINIGSIVGLQGREGQANYAASKAGLIGLTKAAARELGSFNIQVNAVLPGYLATAMGETVSPAIHERVLSENALHRVSDPGEVAAFIQHLALMKNVSGQVFNLDSRIP